MKNEKPKSWQEDLDAKAEEMEAAAKENKTGAYSPEFEATRTAGTKRTQEELRLENNIQKLMAYENVEFAQEHEMEENIKRREQANGLELHSSTSLNLKSDPVDIVLKEELGNKDFLIVVVGTKALVFRRRSWSPKKNPGF